MEVLFVLIVIALVVMRVRAGRDKRQARRAMAAVPSLLRSPDQARYANYPRSGYRMPRGRP